MHPRVAIAATGPASADAGLAAAAAGGNAVDAAIAAMVSAMTTEPGIVSAAGGAYVSVWPAGGDPEVIDGNVEMPGRGQDPARFGAGLREVTTSYGGGLTLYAGHGSVATPGAFAALGTAHDRHGRAPWWEVLAPSITAARTGYAIGGAAASYLAITGDSVFGWDEHTRPLVRGADGAVVVAGQLATNPDLADTLEQIATQGARSLYTGDLAARIAADSEERGGLITAADLAAYRAVVRTPLRLALGEWDLALNPPPSIGGPMLAIMLRELAAGGWDWLRIIEIQRQVLSYRHQVHDLSTDLEEDGYALLESVDLNGLASLPTSSSTAHVSAVDSDGTVCAITASSGYGSGATVPGTGLMLNNCLGEPELNRLGLHALAPGTRLASNMSPTVARSPSGAALAIGSPGADRITTALMQVLGRHCLEGMPMDQAIEAPRVHVRILDDGTPRVDLEDDEGISAAVGALGLPSFSHGPRSMFFGGVGAARLLPDGTVDATGDPRREAATRVSS
ncbi:gamma-glutamyltranspeptidase/glutathione hydrolase [Phycicoccus badiiscoriae]|uniref:Gamma-glutamyltranspeptidase/glutathione hydrolase n=1 Tax=Pedococcus badiiscoriae TaxID=642776 RepID=A0A852WD51_9MICO|nr:gamma-glutamyltransferase [Pedococcus badiiscoriae]NYG06958.1 gamma-glutamyltranspeptidase/glutathione hydrolase [Pedococcus badiiscoriae]